MKRRKFLRKVTEGTCLVSFSPFLPIGHKTFHQHHRKLQDLKLSLAQWSLHRSFNEGKIQPHDFASIAMDTYKIKAVEYVNGFYKEYGEDESFWFSMKARAGNAGVKNLLIMVDDEGELGTSDDKSRKIAVENHYKWVNAAKIMGCHSIRVNAFGEENEDDFRNAIIDGMGKLSEYAAKENINIIIENHGLHSSNGQLIVDIIKQVNRPNFGTLPDFGNWCTSAKWGSTQIECDKVYNIYKGVTDLLPYAKSVSAKSYDFNAQGEQTKIDYNKMLKLVKESKFDGYIGIEYEGNVLSEHDGILATKALIEKVWKSLD